MCDVPYRQEFIVRWRVQLRKNRSPVSTFVEKDSPSSRTTKSSFIRSSANFDNVSPLSSTNRGNKHIFRAYPSTLKIAELCFETTAAHSTIMWSARLGFSPSSRSRNRLCRRTDTSIHSFLIFQKTLYCTRKQRSRLLSLFVVILSAFAHFSEFFLDHCFMARREKKKKRKKTNCKTFCLKRLETGTTCINKGIYYRTSPVHGNILNFHSR